nr:MAG TPA: hypothetical protein [Caudoviricetes sp.]
MDNTGLVTGVAAGSTKLTAALYLRYNKRECFT